MIELINVSKYFGERQVLKNINTQFEDGKVNLIIGRSGSGKTVMMKNLIGLLAPEEGEAMRWRNTTATLKPCWPITWRRPVPF